PSRPLGEEDSVDALRDDATSAKRIRDVASWLLRVTQACDAVVANTRINAVTRISQARLLAAAIHLADGLGESDRERLLSRWEKVSFRIYGMLGNDARTRVGDYVRLAWQVINDGIEAVEIDEAIGEIEADFPIKDAVDGLYADNCYEGWENELRYVLFRYEEHLAAKQKMNYSNEQWTKIWMVSPAESIEHIMPASKASNKQRHRLGNLVLLPPKLNSKLQDLDPEQKAEEYRKTGLLIAGEVADMIESGGWTKQSIEMRETTILKWAAKEWAD
ncbi:MAG TPA: HNH endonuclease family protein, partial [Gemmataceae bacterium]|nr:HNH endonuclease family protein [Gemmataceae bacterium]